jgi:signal peptidase I
VNWRQNLVKRVVGREGDTVEIKDGRVMVNGQERDINGAEADADFGPVKVPAHHLFVLGDNLSASRDSRSFGPVPLAALVARADYLYWPAGDWSRFGRLER